LPVGVRLDQAAINRIAFVTNQAFSHAALQNRLKDAPQEIAFAETAMPILREWGMIRDVTIEPEPAEPPVRQIEVDLFAETPLGPDTEAVSDDEPSGSSAQDQSTGDPSICRTARGRGAVLTDQQSGRSTSIK
jgi:hypothetical protein